MTDFRLKRVSLSTGVELDTVDEGPRDAPVLMFLHGFPESHRTWRFQIPHLSDRFRCIAPDQRGYRGSSKPKDATDYTPDKLTADIFALADALGVEDFTVVGHDWGGVIAWSVALNGQPGAPRPDFAGRVRRAIIANAPHPFIFQRLLFDDPVQRAASQYIRVFRDPASDAVVRESGIAGIMAQAFEGRIPSGGIQPPEEIARLLRDWEDRETCFAMLNWYRGSPAIVPAMGENPPRPVMLDGPFPKLGIPTLVVWAMDDVALPPANLDGMPGLIPDLTIERVQGCGHFVTWEAPEAVNAAIDAFLERTSAIA